MTERMKKYKLKLYYVLGAALGATAIMYPDKVENIARALVLFMGVSLE